MSDIVQDVADLAQSVGLDVYGMHAPTFACCPVVYGPLDSIAILVDTLLQKQAETPRRYRKRRITTTPKGPQ